jgi:hypothetical protein
MRSRIGVKLCQVEFPGPERSQTEQTKGTAAPTPPIGFRERDRATAAYRARAAACACHLPSSPPTELRAATADRCLLRCYFGTMTAIGPDLPPGRPSIVGDA